MPADAYVMDADMKKVADAIRTKGETTGQLTFPDGMVTAIQNIKTGGGSEATAELINGLTIIPESAFYNDSSLTCIGLPNVTRIERLAFEDCNNLSNICFPKLKDLKERAFSKTGLVKVELPLIEAIEDMMFFGCQQLKEVRLPKATFIGMSGFSYCPKLEKVVLGAMSVVTLYTGSGGVFDGVPNVKVYVPDNLLDKYKSSRYWTKYVTNLHPMSELPLDERM